MEDAVVVVPTSTQGEEIFSRPRRVLAKDLNLQIAERRVQGDGHHARVGLSPDLKAHTGTLNDNGRDTTCEPKWR